PRYPYCYTLFPYTTLFRSVVSQADALLHVVDASGGVDAEGKITHPGMGNPVIDVYDIEEELILWFKVAVDRALQRTKKKSLKTGDRKSTRLNSSHLGISYA